MHGVSGQWLVCLKLIKAAAANAHSSGWQQREPRLLPTSHPVEKEQLLGDDRDVLLQREEEGRDVDLPGYAIFHDGAAAFVNPNSEIDERPGRVLALGIKDDGSEERIGDNLRV